MKLIYPRKFVLKSHTGKVYLLTSKTKIKLISDIAKIPIHDIVFFIGGIYFTEYNGGKDNTGL